MMYNPNQRHNEGVFARMKFLMESLRKKLENLTKKTF